MFRRHAISDMEHIKWLGFIQTRFKSVVQKYTFQRRSIDILWNGFMECIILGPILIVPVIS